MKLLLACFLLAVTGFAQNIYTFAPSTLPANIIGGGVGTTLGVNPAANPTITANNTQAFVFYAHNVIPSSGTYDYNLGTFANGAVTTGMGVQQYLGTLFGRVNCYGGVAPGVSMTITAIGNVFDTGGNCFAPIHAFKNGGHLEAGFGGERAFSNQPAVNSYNLRGMLGYSW